jgi:hypothetical protein
MSIIFKRPETVVITSGKPRRRGVRLLAGVAVAAAAVACAVIGGPALGVVHLLFGVLAFAAVAGTAAFAYLMATSTTWRPGVTAPAQPAPLHSVTATVVPAAVPAPAAVKPAHADMAIEAPYAISGEPVTVRVITDAQPSRRKS